MIAASLCEVAARGDTELDAQVLEQDRHQIGNHDDGQECVTKLGATREISGPIAWIHVAHRDQESRASECSEFPPERGRPRNNNAPVNFRERNVCGASAPRCVPLPSHDVVRLTHEFTLL
jgi:hypothetical protein